MKRICTIVFLLIFCLLTSFAYHPIVRNFSSKTIKAGTQNWDIIRHNNGWIYFANNEGLLEFNGLQWGLHPIGNYTNVRSLFYDDKSDRIYAGAFNEFGYFERNSRGIINYTSLIDLIAEKERNFNEIWKINGNEDELLFQGTSEVFLFKSNEIKRFNFSERISTSAYVHGVYFIAKERSGVFMKQGDIFVQLPNSDLLNSVKICSILPFGENQILLVSDFNGLFIFDGKETRAYYSDMDRFLTSNQVFCADISDNTLAIGTVRNGIVVKDLNTNHTTYSNLHSGLQNNTVLSIRFDNMKNLWLGLDKGIDYVQINSPVQDLFGNKQAYGSGYASLLQGTTLYLGTNQGLYTTGFPLHDTSVPVPLTLVDGMQGQVWSLREIDNRIFCGTDHGAFILKNGKPSKINGVPGTWDFVQLKNRDDIILASSYQGFFILKNKNNDWFFSHYVKGFGDGGGMFAEDDDGNIWFSHWMKGIYKLTFTDSSLQEFDIKLYDDSKGLYTSNNIRLSTIGDRIVFMGAGGLFQYDDKSDEIIRAHDMESVFGAYPLSIGLQEMNNGDVWILAPNRVEVAHRNENNSYLIDKTSFADLKSILIPGFEQFYEIEPDKVIVNTQDGFSILDLRNKDAQEFTPQVSINRVYLTSERDSLVGGYLSEQKETLSFPHKLNSVRFEFIASEYRRDVSVQYSCLLENYDTEWSSYSPANTKEYTRLPKGNYTFRVRAQSALSDQHTETTYHFAILPAWYESNWARVFYAILILLALYVSFLFIKRKSEEGARNMQIKKEDEMRQQEKRFMAESKEKEQEIVKLRNQQLKYDLRHKSQELANSTMNLIRKNEILLDISRQLENLSGEVADNSDKSMLKKRLNRMQSEIKKNIERDDNWKKFEANFDLVYENYLTRLGDQFPELTVSDKKLCAYLKMGLSSKDIAPLMNITIRSVEMNRYRLRKKLMLEREVNLVDFLQRF